LVSWFFPLARRELYLVFSLVLFQRKSTAY
jgi:hypothetical protein